MLLFKTILDYRYLNSSQHVSIVAHVTMMALVAGTLKSPPPPPRQAYRGGRFG